MTYQWLLFDADGTLFNYDLAEKKALTNVFKEYALPFREEYENIYQTVNSRLWKRFEQNTITLKQLRVQRFLDLFETIQLVVEDPATFSERYLYHLGQGADLFPDVLEVLTQLKPLYRLGLITNGISQVQRSRLALSPLDGFFEQIFISDEMGVSKPDQAYFEMVFEGIGHPPKDSVLVIGDSLSSDIAGGINYGLDTCWVNPNGSTAPAELPIKYQIRTLSQILKFLI